MKTVAGIALVAAAIVSAACSGDRILPTDPNSTTPLSVVPSVDSVLAGDTVRFTTQDSQPASWTVSDSRVAAIENQAGRSALVRALHPGTTTVTAAEGLRTASGVLIVERLG